MKRYLYNILIGIDQLVNVVLAGDPDETMSSRMGKHVAKHDNWFCGMVCKLLNLIQKDHCMKAIEKDRGLPM